MSSPQLAHPDLPEFLTWEELELLPEEVAGQIELWNGRVVWVRRGPAEHQVFTLKLTNSLMRCASDDMSHTPQRCWRVSLETNAFFGHTGKSDFVTPDFLVYRCLDKAYQDVRASDVLLAGEVLSPGNKQTDIEAKKAKYAKAGIPWYWEVALEPAESAIATVRAYALETGHGELPAGVRPLHPANYVLAGEWLPRNGSGVDIDFPFPISVPWAELAF